MGVLGYSYPRLVLVALLGTLVVTLAVAAGTSAASLGAYNSAWDGTSEIRTTAASADTATVLAQNVSAYEQATPNRTVAFVLSPTESYGDNETAPIASFVQAGGTLVVAEDYGPHSNPLLGDVGATARVDGTPLRDEQRAGPSPAFPKATPGRNHSYTTDVDSLMLNHGSVVRPGDATVLVNSSSFSYLDTNGDETLDDTETLTSRPIVTVEQVGQGTVVVISDPSIFLNAMLERSDNAAFLQALVGPPETVLLDVSHTAALPPLVAVRLWLQDVSVPTFAIGTLSVLAVVVLLSGRATLRPLERWRAESVEPPGLSSDEIANSIRKQHPDWDEERVGRVTDSLIQHRQQGQGDD
ncbi:DUF4350 domain-containing protein [Halomicroarcula sp. GCM10025817]|uniref:DUF4350 domain-containing protein n=1 Tax=Haloarcula TaxID=2237 RepID=UPI0023E8C9F0|nr:DUF4350 domain-containing protein [Halomicroarcula sp. SYNS111]